ncbi:MAG: translocation/assembly module TamB domain-containing protein, partial [Balneolales bacterium]|nr:translocation/assembly module TamB domain-containing protein [Balneolales bacterium]
MRSLLIVFGIVALVSLIIFGIIQLPSAQSYVARSIEGVFNETFNSELSIGELSGLIPFNMRVDDILLVETQHPDDERPVDEVRLDTLISIKSVDIRVNPLDFLRNSISAKSLTIESPSVQLVLDSEGEFYKLERAYQRQVEVGMREPTRISEIEIFVPFLAIRDGSVVIEMRQPGVSVESRDPALLVEDIQLSAFAELNERQRYLDIQFLNASVPAWGEDNFQLSGQIFNDNRYLELNAFRFQHASSNVAITGEISNINILAGDVRSQLLEADYSIQMDTSLIYTSDFAFLNFSIPDLTHPLSVTLRASGDLDELNIEQTSVRYGDSGITFVGDLVNLKNPHDLTYDGNLRQFNIAPQDIHELIPESRSFQFQDLNLLSMRGRIFGSLDRTDVDLRIQTSSGTATINGDIQWMSDLDYYLKLGFQQLDLSQFVSLSLPESDLNGQILAEGKGLQATGATLKAELNIYNSSVLDFTIDEMNVESTFENGVFAAHILWEYNGSEIVASSRYDTRRTGFGISGESINLNLKDLFPDSDIAETSLNVLFALDIAGNTIDELTGRFNIDMLEGTINGEIAPPHQLYADLIEAGNGQRQLRFTSTMFDFDLSGDLYPQKLLNLAEYWSDYVEDRLEDEITFTESSLTAVELDEYVNSRVELVFDLDIKDLTLLQLYFPEMTDLDTDLSADIRLQVDKQRMLLNGGISGSQLRFQDTSMDMFNLQFTSNLQAGRKLSDFSVIDIEFHTDKFDRGILDITDMHIGVSMLNENTTLSTTITQIGTDDYGLRLGLLATLADSSVNISISDFEVGNERFNWLLQESSQARYTSDNKFHIDGLMFVSENQQIDIRGTYSSEMSDSMLYRFNNVDIGRISALIDGRSTFDGILDGEFASRSLLNDPTVSGDIFLDGLLIDGRLIGDLTFNSVFDSATDRFNTNINVYTDPEKYASYLSANEGRGNNISITGWFRAPDENVTPSDTLYHFDVDMREVDAWILVPILPGIFEQTEGIAAGTGVFTGTAEDFYFNAKIDVKELFAVPQFILTNYWLSGQVEIDRNDGVTLRDVTVNDSGQGTGRINGNIGFNDFQDERPFNLVMDMNRLQFLNNSFDVDVPFYGSVAGTGRVSLTGSNLSPFLRTLTPITTTSNSRLAIPLLAETTVEEQARFIEFVSSFDELFQPKTEEAELLTRELLRDLTFAEYFRLDLQFNAPPGTTVQLVFDPLTGEVLNARGSGRIRVTLEDEEFQMFGNFDVSSGDYTFVAGDI